MLTAEATVETEHSSRYLVQLCKHASKMGGHLRQRARRHGDGDAPRFERSFNPADAAIVVCDEDPTASLVESLGYQSVQTSGLAGALEQLEHPDRDPAFVLLGFDLEDGSGLDALTQVRDCAPDLPIGQPTDDLWDLSLYHI